MHPPLPDGTVIQNRYRIERVLGQGGFGRTYLAIDTNRFNEFCVLKEFAPQDQSATNLRKAEDLFTREAGVLYQLRHAQIPRFREMFRVHYLDRELLFLAQDYIEGTTYEALMDARLGQGFSEAEILQLLHQIFACVDLHSQRRNRASRHCARQYYFAIDRSPTRLDRFWGGQGLSQQTRSTCG